MDKALVATHSVANNVQWLIVPRHPQRFDAVAALIESHGFAVLRRSSWGQGGPAAAALVAPLLMSTLNAPPAIWLGDSLGEMALYYGLADVALLGGSFEPLGGQNLIEAAACGCPVVMGPHTFNFADAAQQAEQLGAALRVSNMVQAVTLAADLSADATQLAAAVSAAAAFGRSHQGATQQLVGAIKKILGTTSSTRR